METQTKKGTDTVTDATPVTTGTTEKTENIGKSPDDDAVASDTWTFFANPEWKSPDLNSPTTVWAGEETMHPCWAARRISRKGLEDVNAIANKSKKNAEQCRFNLGLEPKQYTYIAVGVGCNAEQINVTHSVVVQFLTNTVKVREGEELIFEVYTKPPAAKRPLTWRDHVGPREKDKADKAMDEAKSKLARLARS